ncbi:MAG TPA: dihydroorotase [Deltaproteobacteria bacterium]|nr:dihydroorotase [Deltaproteobacteria bacterium]
MERVVLRGGRIIDPSQDMEGLYDIFIMGGRVASIKPAEEGSPVGEGWLEYDCKGLVVAPGFVDLHTHLREPGEEYKETIKTGTLAAAAGGFTTILCMANTTPPNDSEAVTRFIKKRAEEEGTVKVHPVGAITKGLEGKELTEMAELKEAGCVAVSDDGRPLMNTSLMRRALEYAGGLGLTVISHCEDIYLKEDGVMNEGFEATRLGLKGIPAQVESIMIARDIELCELTGSRLHIAHVSTRRGVELIRDAKRRGVNVTAEATPHHLLLTDRMVGYDTDFKMNPPLRTEEDVEALREALKDGTIDCVATDHAPHSSIEKDVEFDMAKDGVVGLETAFGVLMRLVHEGVLTLKELVRLLSTEPAKLMGLQAGSLSVGSPADVVVIDTEREWTVEPETFRSLSRNTPFKGWTLKGRVVRTFVDGRVVYEEE